MECGARHRCGFFCLTKTKLSKAVPSTALPGNCLLQVAAYRASGAASAALAAQTVCVARNFLACVSSAVLLRCTGLCGRRELIRLVRGLQGTRVIASHDLEFILET